MAWYTPFLAFLGCRRAEYPGAVDSPLCLVSEVLYLTKLKLGEINNSMFFFLYQNKIKITFASLLFHHNMSSFSSPRSELHPRPFHRRGYPTFQSKGTIITFSAAASRVRCQPHIISKQDPRNGTSSSVQASFHPTQERAPMLNGQNA